MSDFLEAWQRDARQFLGPIRREVGYPEDPYDPDAWPPGKEWTDVMYEYIAALENTIVAQRRIQREFAGRAFR